MHEQEIAAPEALARDRPVGLRVDGEEDARRAVDLRHAPHQHQHVAVRIGVDGARPQRLLLQRHGVEIGVVVARQRAHGAGLNGVADHRQITRERGRQPALLGGRGIDDAEPLRAGRRLAARAPRIAERQAHLEGEIGAQIVHHVGAVGLQRHRDFVFAEAERVEQDVARFIAQHVVERRPRRLLVERGVEQLLDPGRKQIFRPAIPRRAQRPEAPGVARGGAGLSRATAMSRVILPHSAGSVVARQRRVPGPRGRRGHLGEPDVRRPVEPVVRFDGDAAVGRDQRQLAVERLFGGEDDAQRRALPRRERRGQDREPDRVVAGFRSRAHCRRQGRRKLHPSSATALSQPAVRPACSKQLSPHPEALPWPQRNYRERLGRIIAKFITMRMRR